jgi:Protein of unknown function (DUF3592)
MLPKTALSARTKTKKSSAVAMAGMIGFFALLSIVIGGFGSYSMLIRPVASIVAARSWVPTPCTIITSVVTDHRVSEGNRTYSLEVKYSYRFAGKPHDCDRYDFSPDSSGSSGWRNEIVDSLPPGRVTTCYVDPRDPSRAVIDRDPSLGLLLGLFPLVFFVAGLSTVGGAGWWYLTGRHQGREMLLPVGQALARALARCDNPVAPSTDSAPLLLKPEISRRSEILRLLFATVFWNGLLSVFVFTVWTSTDGNGPDLSPWIVWAFLTPFLAVGVLLVVQLGLRVLGLFNPQPVLTLDRACVPLGGKARLAWSLEGRWESVESLSIHLKGSEKPTDSEGSSGVERVFHDEIVLERKLPDAVAAGACELVIPSNSMHSFSSKRGSIVWKAAVLARIAWWPSVRANFPIRVTPHE